jgi:predicted nucleotidyltransferase
MDYYKKYLKYRSKYLELKSQLGGTLCEICGGNHNNDICPNKLSNAPVAPVASVAPVAPIAPIAPVASVAPVAPVASVAGEDDDWSMVAPRQRKAPVQRPPPPNISYEELIRILRKNLVEYGGNIEAGYVYGSRARGNNKPTSDADIIIFWKIKPDTDILKQIRANIEKELGIEIDFVSCYYTRGFVNHVDLRDKAYFENIIGDAKQFMGQSINIATLIEYSIKMPKLKRY